MFGSFGMLAFFVSVAAGLYALFETLSQGGLRANATADSGIVMFAVGIQVSADGFAGRNAGWTYHESQEKSIYAVRGR